MLRKGEEGNRCLPKVRLVTGNPGKAKEFRELGKIYGVEVVIIDLPKVEIQNDSLETISVVSAIDLGSRLGNAICVEDAGLFIESLKGFPGPYSSYVYKTIGVQGIIKMMEGIKNRRAYFKSVITYYNPRTQILRTFTGVVRGFIANEARGSEGFGFDPIFIPKGYEKTFAELGINVKNKISHRSKAFKELVNWLRSKCITE